MLGDDEPKQHAPRDPKNTFFGIELDAVHPEFRKGAFNVGNKVVSPLGFDYDVIDIGLNGSPNEVSETLEYTSMVFSSHVFRPKGIVT